MVQVGPNDVPYMCPRCQQTTLHRAGPDGQWHCLACLTRPQQPLQQQFQQTGKPVPVRVTNYKGRSLFVHWILPILVIGAIALIKQNC